MSFVLKKSILSIFIILNINSHKISLIAHHVSETFSFGFRTSLCPEKLHSEDKSAGNFCDNWYNLNGFVGIGVTENCWWD